MLITEVKYIFVNLWLVALLRVGSSHHVPDNSLQTNDVDATISGSLLKTPATIPAATKVPANIRHRRASLTELTSFCLTPQQPANGQYKLEKYFCGDGDGNEEDCIISEGERLEPGSQLAYTCNSGYRATGKTDVTCRSRGKWSPIPSCVEVKCESLNSASTMVQCRLHGEWINCDSSVPPETRAELACRPGYKKETGFLSTNRGTVRCNINGKWEPNPIRCVPACGRVITPQRPLALGATPAKIGDFPWHASLFVEKNLPTGKRKDFICGATIIQTNLVLTAAHCVYDESTETTTDPAKLFVMTGNIFRDYDSTVHNPELVRKAAVKNVHISCNYYGLRGNYASDIGLLELQQPFDFSNILSPACLDDSGYGDQFLEHGVLGKVAGFGRTASSSSSVFLQTLTLPFVSYSQCRISNNAERNEAFISSDKFCAGYNNGSAVCEGDSGGGLVFKKGDLWYVMGIVSVGLGVDIYSGERTCDKYSYSLYTKVSNYMPWIHDVLYYLENKQSVPPCSPYTKPSIVATTKPTATESAVTRRSETTPSTAAAVTYLTSSAPRLTFASGPIPASSCLAPPQPNNGNRHLHPSSCENRTDCNIREGTPLELGSQLVYSCVGDLALNGTTDVYCRPGRSWTAIPTCTGKLGDGRGEIARKKCAYYSQFVYTLRYSTFGDREPVNVSECAIASQKLIVGATEAERKKFPHMTAIGYNQQDGTIGWFCDGTLVSENWVITAAHCIYSKNLGDAAWARVGDLNLVDSVKDGANPVTLLIVERIKHPDYKPPAEYNDIALVRLEKDVELNPWVRPACLHTSESTGTTKAVATGWGRVNWNNGDGQSHFLKFTMALVDSATCQARWTASGSKVKVPNGINAMSMICAAGEEGKDTCQGHSGGPLVIFSPTEYYCTYDLVGVTSIEKSCMWNLPGLYTRVYNYVPWIESIVWPQG